MGSPEQSQLLHAYYDELERRGVETEGPPNAEDYEQTQFAITDSNGYRICFTETTAKK